MPRTRNWRTLLPGLLALGATVGAAVAVLTFARVGALHGATARLYTRTAEARGVIKGTAVWLSGQKVGQVKSVELLPPGTDTSARVLIVMDGLEEHMPYIRKDARAQIRAGGTLIGAPVVYLSSTTTASPLVADGDTVTSLPQGDPEGVASRIAHASRDFPAIIQNVKELRAELSRTAGTTGAFLNGEELQLDVVKNRSMRLANRAMRGDGTIGRALNGDAASRAKVALAHADSVRTLVSSGAGAIGRFRSDTSLLRTVASLRDEVSLARALLDEPRGTAGRAVHDSALVTELKGVERELGALMADIRAHPIRYVHF
jgi:phospholipid/cholesterol/gamma-HCH transport system substrate-binding protein